MRTLTEIELLSAPNADSLLRADATAVHGMPSTHYEPDAQGPVLHGYNPAGPRHRDSALADAWEACVADPYDFDAACRFVALQRAYNEGSE